MNRLRLPLLLPVVGACLWLGLGNFVAPAGAALAGAKVGGMEQAVTQTLRFEQWLNPATGETVKLRYDGQKTTLERGGKVQPVTATPFDEAAARAQLEMMNQMQQRWDVLSVLTWREQWLSGRYKSLAEAKAGFIAAGFPAKLWEDINTFSRAIGRPILEDGSDALGTYFSAMTLEGDGTLTVSMGEKTTVIRFSDPQWKDNLLVNPTPRIQALYAALNAFPAVDITPPSAQAQAESALWEQSTQLAKQGFIRLSPRRPDGSLWLPPALEPFRAELHKLERPVVRPYVKSGKPALWDSKFGGMPYRPKGAAWPVGRSGKPLHFLAQIDLGQANKEGALPDLPRQGLLQFFLAQSDATYEQMQAHPDWGDPSAKVVYWPEIVKDNTALSHEVPDFSSDDFDNDGFNPPEHAMGFVTDTEIPSSLDALLQFTEPKNAHTGVGEDYQQAENNSKVQPNGHRLRGYPMVINAYFPPAEDWQLLFQFDGDDYGKQLYGENGAMGGWLGFFVRGSDLKKLDFSRVRLEMDAF